MKELAGYLRRRRAVVTPEQVNLVWSGHRRVPGLRREEVALLAGVSVDYYTRLEQGRETSPSAQVLDALATALRLPYDGRLHLFRLAGLAPRTRVAVTAQVDPLLQQLLDAWPGNPLSFTTGLTMCLRATSSPTPSLVGRVGRPGTT